MSADPEQSYWYGMSKVASAVSDIFEDAAKWEPIGTKSLSGYERSRVLLNREGRAFRDVAADVGVTDLLDGRAVAFADLFNRGVLDALVANQNQPLLLYENEVEPGRHWAQFKLVGTKSNRSAIGARVTIEFGGHVQSQVVAAGSGFAAQNDRRLHFGLGAAERIDGGGDTGFTRNEFMVKSDYHWAQAAARNVITEVKLGYSDEGSDETYLGISDDDFAVTPDRRYAASQISHD